MQNEGMAKVCWGIAAIAFLTATLISEETLSKTGIYILGLGIVWLIAGIIHWKGWKKT